MTADTRAVIDECDYLFLREIGQPDDNTVRVIIQEAAAEGTSSSDRPVEFVELLRDARQIISLPHHRTFEIVWPSFVAYCVTNESFSTPDANDEHRVSGNMFRVYSRSHFLEHVARSTIATNEYPGPLQHIRLVCLNHIVDVVSTESPQIRTLGGLAQRIV
jgi:hypothetical protein